MPTDNILKLLIAERDKLNRAIGALQGPPRRRGRPPKAGAAGIGTSPTRQRRRRPMSAAVRKAASERMKAFWAAHRAAKASKGKKRGKKS